MSSLKYRIAITIFLIEVIMLTSVIWQTLSQSINNSQQQLLSIQKTTLEIVEQSARIALFTEEFDSIQLRMEKLAEDPSVLHAILVDHRDIVVASNLFSDLGNVIPVIKDGDETYWRELEIGNENDRMGSLMVEYSREPLQEIYQNALRRGISIGVLGVLISASVSLLLGTILTRKLTRVVNAADDVARGNYSVRSGLKGEDEISRLGISFDSMVAHIEKERKQLKDINRELEERVRERTQHLEVLNNELKSFSYSVSHDLQAPLRRISGFSQILQEDYIDELDAEGKTLLKRMEHNCADMSQLIDSLLALARIGQKNLNKSQIDISELAEKAVNGLKESHDGPDIEVNIMPGMNGFADQGMISRVLDNLLSNAWKFTQKSSHPKIEVGIKSGQPDVYYVSDNGAGFDPAKAESLFTPFQRLHSNDDFDGTGIGLSTVQRIIHRHGGEIWAESEVDKGATFYFTLGANQNSGISILSA